MDGKPKISPTHTYVFDESDIEQFDDLSLSSVLPAIDFEALSRDVDLGAADDSDTASFKLTDFDDTHFNLDDFDATPAFDATATDVELSIDALLDASAQSDEDEEKSAVKSDSFEILIAPEEYLGTGSDDS